MYEIVTRINMNFKILWDGKTDSNKIVTGGKKGGWSIQGFVYEK